MWVAFANFPKATHIFSAKNTCELDAVLTRTVNNLTINELVKLTKLWTTGPWCVRTAVLLGVHHQGTTFHVGLTMRLQDVADSDIIGAGWSANNDAPVMGAFSVSVIGILGLLLNLRPGNAAGPDLTDLSPFCWKNWERKLHPSSG